MMRTKGDSRIRAIVAAIATAALTLGLALAPTAANADDLPAQLDLDKTITSATVTPLVPGGTVFYRVEVACSNLEPTGCVAAAVTDTIPAPLVLDLGSIAIAGPSSVNTSSGNTLSVTFTQALLGGTTGLDDGESAVITYSASLPTNVSGDADGVPLVNTARFTATNASNSPLTRTATITPVVPKTLLAGAGKTVTPETAPGVPGTEVRFELTGSNESNRAVDSLTIQDTADDATENPFDHLALVGIAELTAPTGADRVSVSWFDGTDWTPASTPVEIPADPNDLLPTTTPALPDILGVRFTFSRSAGGTLPTTPNDGDARIVLDTQMRDSVETLPTTTLTNRSSTTVTSGAETSPPATASDTIVITESTLGPFMTKEFAATTLVPGESTTASLEARNGDFVVTRLSVEEPKVGEPDLTAQGLRFDGFDAAALQWPIGATEAQFSYRYSDSDPVTPVTLDEGDPFPAPESGRTVVGFRVDFTGTIPAGAYAAIEFDVTALALGGGVDVTSTNTVLGEVQRGTQLGSATASDDLTRTPARVNTTVDKRITRDEVWGLAGSGAVIALDSKVNSRTDDPASTVGAQSLVIADPAVPGAAPDEFWDRFDVRAIGPMAVPANATLTVQYWNGSDWIDLDGATGIVGPDADFALTIPSGVRADASGIRFSFVPTTPGTLLQPGFSVVPYVQVALRSTLRSDPSTPVIAPDATEPLQLTNTALSTVRNEFADPTESTDDSAAPIAIRPTDSGPGIDLGSKEWIDPVGDPPVVQARTGDSATARISWGTDFAPLDRVVISDPSPSSPTADDLPAVSTTVYDAFDLVRVEPITDPLMTFDAVVGLWYFSESAGEWVDVTAEACGADGAACDGAFPGWTPSEAQRADAVGVRIAVAESPTRADRITSPFDPAVGSGVAASGATRPLDLVFELRDDRRSDGSPVTGHTLYNTGEEGLVENTVRITGIVDDAPEYSTVDGDDILIQDVPLNVTVTKAFDQDALGLPPVGTADDRYPLTVATITARNETAARVDTLELADPDPDATGTSAFELLNLYQIMSVSVPAGATDSRVLITYGSAPATPVSYSVFAALALTPTALADAIAIQVVHDGRIEPDASTTLVYAAQLRPTTRTAAAPVVAGDIADNTVRTWVRDGGGLASQNGVATDVASDVISVVAPTYSVTATKTITPAQRYQEDPARTVTVSLGARPGGTVRTTDIALTDDEATFWNAYAFTGFSPIVLARPITEVRVEALVGVEYTVLPPAAPGDPETIQVTCGGDPDLAPCWVLVDTVSGASGSTVTPTLPGTIDPDDIRGLRYTATRTDGANWERPYNPLQTIAFTADRRVDLVTGGPVPSTQPTIPATSPAPGETVLGRTSDQLDVLATGSWVNTGLSPSVIWTADATADDFTDLLHRTNAVQIVKTPAGTVSPGTGIPFAIAVKNTGDRAMGEVVIVDQIETDGNGPRLVIPALDPDDPGAFSVSLVNAGGVAQTAPAMVLPTSIPADGRLEFTPTDPSWTLPTGWTLTISATLQLRADIVANEVVANDATVTSDRVFDSCVGAVDRELQPALINVADCATVTHVDALAASPLRIVKGVKGDGAGLLGAAPGAANYDDLGVLAFPGAPSTDYCADPNTLEDYYRTPCVPITRPGGTELWRSFVTNAGNIPSVRVSMIDVLPAPADRGVIIDQARSSRWQPVFTGGLELDVLRGGNLSAAAADVDVLYMTTVPATVCNRLDIYQGIVNRPVTSADLLSGEPASCVAEVNSGRDWLPYDESTMDAAALASVKILKVVVAYAEDPATSEVEGLQPGETLTLSYSSTTAAFPSRAESDDRDSIAWNSVAGGALGFDVDQQIAYPSQVREARKTGVAMALGTIDLAKEVVTPSGFPGVTLPSSYAFDVECTSLGQTVPLVGLPSPTVPASKSRVTLAADGTVLRYNDGADPVTSAWSNVNLPLYAECGLTEVPSQGAEVTYSPEAVTALRTFASRSDVANAPTPEQLAPDGILQITATNEYHLAGFRVSKTVVAGGAQTGDGDAIAYAGPFRFDAVCTFLGQTVLDAEFDVTPGTPVERTGLPAGSSCTLTELGANGAALASTSITTTVAGSETTTSGKSTTFTLAKNTGDDEDVIDNTVDATNTFTTGALRITKTVGGAGAADWGDASFGVHVVCTLAAATPSTVYDETVTVSKASPTVTIDGLATGASCAVTETATGGATVSSVSPGTVVIGSTPSSPQLVSVINTFRVGTVQVTKALEGLPAAGLSPATTDTYTFAIQCTREVNGETEEVSPIPGGATRTVTGATSAQWAGLPTGASCVVSETDAGHATSTTLSPTGGAVTVGSGTTVTVTATNAFANGEVSVSKVVQGASSSSAPEQFTATVSCTWQGAAVPLPDGGEITLTDGATVSVSPVPVGSVCSVTEADAGQRQPTVSVPESVTVTDGSTPTVTLALTNVYEEASLRVSKTVESTATPVPVDFGFNVLCTFLGDTVLDESFTLDDGGSRDFTGLPARSTCVVTEVDDQDAEATIVDGESTTGQVTLDQDDRTVTITELAPDSLTDAIEPNNSAEFTNLYGVSGLVVTKSLEGGAAELGDGQVFPVRVVCTYSGQTLLDETVDLVGGSDPSRSWTGLVAGSVCEITETDSGTADAVVILPNDGDRTVGVTTVPEDGVADVIVENWYLTGSVTVTKYFEGDAAEKFGTREYPVQLTCTLRGDPVELPAGGLAELSADAPTATWPGLPTGTECSIVESGTGGATSTRIIDATEGAAGPTLVAPATSPYGFVIVTDPEVRSVDDQPQMPLGVVNVFDFAEIAVDKTVDSGGALDAEGEPIAYGPFEVTLSCTLDGLPVSPLEDATRTLADGEVIRWTELPVGADCTVEESDAADAAETTMTVTQSGETDEGVPGTTVALAPLASLEAGNAVSVLNRYEVGSVLVAKLVTGSQPGRASGPFPVQLTCTLVDASHPAPGLLVRDVEGLIGGPDALEIEEGDLPAGTECVITELDAGTADSTAIIVDDAEPVTGRTATFVLEAAAPSEVTVIVRNTFDLPLQNTGGPSAVAAIGISLALLGLGGLGLLVARPVRRRGRHAA